MRESKFNSIFRRFNQLTPLKWFSIANYFYFVYLTNFLFTNFFFVYMKVNPLVFSAQELTKPQFFVLFFTTTINRKKIELQQSIFETIKP